MKRRDFVKTGVVGGAGLLLPWSRSSAQTPPSLTPFVDRLPIPPVLPRASNYVINMTQFNQKLHRDLPPTPVWGYNGSYPGPTFDVQSGSPVTVQWVNNLPSTHIFADAIDPTVHGCEPGTPQVRSVVHLHGAKVLPQFDGYPESWFTNPATHVNPPNFRNYHYPNDQASTQLWYHDHSLGSTRLNVYAGLLGVYLIRDSQEQQMRLPSGSHEIPLIFNDREFTVDPATNRFTGGLLYPTPDHPIPGFPSAGVTPHHPLWATETWASFGLVNGKVYPFLEVEPRKYRFRMLNANNARFLRFTLKNLATNAGLSFLQIGSDQGFLLQPVRLSSLLMGNAERFDVIVDFSGLQGQTFTLLNDAPAPYPAGGGGPDVPMWMQFRVTLPLSSADTFVPAALMQGSSMPSHTDGIPVRDIRLDEIEDTELDEMRDPHGTEDPNDPPDGSDETGSPVLGMLELQHWSAPVTTAPTVGSIEVWRFINLTPDTHPIHVHLVRFLVLDRQQFNVDLYKQTGQIQFTGPLMPADPNERFAPKDVVRVEQGTITRIIMKFDLPNGTVTVPGQKFRYIFHCHILEHEDNEMMRPMDVVAQ